jgi:hypothetical protein
VVVRLLEVTYPDNVLVKLLFVTYKDKEDIVAYVALAVAERRYEDRLEASAKKPLLFMEAVAIEFKGK